MTLREASGHDDLCTGAAPSTEREHDVDRFLPGLFDEGARVHDDEIGGLG